MYLSLSQTYTYQISCRSYKASMCTEVPVGSTQIHYTEVPVGTTGLILILQNLYLYYRYGSTRRYYRDFTCTKIPVGTFRSLSYSFLYSYSLFRVLSYNCLTTQINHKKGVGHNTISTRKYNTVLRCRSTSRSAEAPLRTCLPT